MPKQPGVVIGPFLWGQLLRTRGPPGRRLLWAFANPVGPRGLILLATASHLLDAQFPTQRVGGGGFF